MARLRTSTTLSRFAAAPANRSDTSASYLHVQAGSGQKSSARNYIASSDEADREAFEHVAGEVRALVEQAQTDINKPERAELVDAIDGNLNTYMEGFSRIVALQETRHALVERMNTVGPKSERNLTEVMKTAFRDDDATASYHAGIALRHLLLARLYSNRFLVDNLEASAERAVTELDAFMQAANRMRDELQNPTRQKLAREVAALAADYRDTFTKVRDTIFERNRLRAQVLEADAEHILTAAEQIME